MLSDLLGILTAINLRFPPQENYDLILEWGTHAFEKLIFMAMYCNFQMYVEDITMSVELILVIWHQNFFS